MDDQARNGHTGLGSLGLRLRCKVHQVQRVQVREHPVVSHRTAQHRVHPKAPDQTRPRPSPKPQTSGRLSGPGRFCQSSPPVRYIGPGF